MPSSRSSPWCLLLAAVCLWSGLAGCGGAGSDPSDDNHGYGWEHDVAGASGLRLRYDPEVPARERAGLEVFERTFAEVSACTGLAAPGPLVVVVPRGTLDARAGSPPPPGLHVGGLYYFDTDLVLVTASLGALRHELIHYLLDRYGYPEDRNRAHAHGAFTTCVGPAAFTWSASGRASRATPGGQPGQAGRDAASPAVPMPLGGEVEEGVQDELCGVAEKDGV